MRKPPARKPTRPIRPEPVDPPAPAGPEYPYVWYPDVAFNLYGLNLDLDNIPGAKDALKGVLDVALAGLLPGAAVDVQFGLDFRYPGQQTSYCLSIGAWLASLTDPNDRGAIDARRRGLFELRKAGQTANRGEILLNFAVLDQFIRRKLIAIPGSLPAGAPAITLSGIGVVATPPATVTVSTFLTTAVPVLGSVNHAVTMLVAFERTALGNIQVRATNLSVSGDFLIGTFDASAILPLILKPIAAFTLRELSMGGNKLSVNYLDPLIEHRGQRKFVSGQQTIVFPVTWALGLPTPTLSLDGPNKVVIAGPRKVASYRAVTDNFANPAFVWKFDGRVQAGMTGSSAAFTFLASSVPASGPVTHRIEVTATEPGPAGATKSASLRTTVQLREDP